MYNNFSGNYLFWIIILFILFYGWGSNSGCGCNNLSNNNDCGCNNGCGCC